ncbi:haloacid dehalogenase [Streptomyces sp. Tu 3180]|uniref:HAD family hydrolase n=1 Tax=Streptomyces sp. Tu 3180 TaxID=2682611 RepID=UPI00135CE846|nr:haloacid dehalogenase [Streptomyces sp. Tu 3180]KAF3463523.1 haloacid dehalogenase [Streptomyces sp. Tu 3180]
MADHIGVVFFSVDCVLVRGRTLTHAVEECLGLRATAAGPDDARPDAARWAGVSEDALRVGLEEFTPLPGVRETTDWCRRSGLVPVASSLTWAPIAAHLADRFGFHSYSGRPLETREGRFTGRVAEPSRATAPRDFAVRRADELGVSLADCAAVGACPADGPLFEVVGIGIAFNAPDDVRALADTTVDGDDLRAVIPALERLTAGTR